MTTSAKLLVSPEKPYVVVLHLELENKSKNTYVLTYPNDDLDIFEEMQIAVVNAGGQIISESEMAKNIKDRMIRDGSTVAVELAPNEKKEFEIQLNDYFVLPTEGGYTVTAVPPELLHLNDKIVSVTFSCKKSDPVIPVPDAGK